VTATDDLHVIGTGYYGKEPFEYIVDVLWGILPAAGGDLCIEMCEVNATYWSRSTRIAFPVAQWAFLAVLWRWMLGRVWNGRRRWIRSQRQHPAAAVSAAVTAVVWIVEIGGCVLEPRLVILLVVPFATSLMIAALTLAREQFPASWIGPGDADQLDRTGTFYSNRLLWPVLWNSNLHAAHHFAPKVPAHWLRQPDSVVSKIQNHARRWPGYYRCYHDPLHQFSWTPVDLSMQTSEVAEITKEP
jgi:fatty acid desaturase